MRRKGLGKSLALTPAADAVEAASLADTLAPAESRADIDARKAEEDLLNILKRYVESLNAIEKQEAAPEEKKISRNAQRSGLALDIGKVNPSIKHLAHNIRGVDEDDDGDGRDAVTSNSDESAPKFELDCSALEAVHITIAALTTSPLEWDFTLLRLVQLLIVELKRLHKLPTEEQDQEQAQTQEQAAQAPVSDAVVSDALARASDPEAAKAAGPNSNVFTAQFAKTSFPKPFIAQLARLYQLAHDRFAHAGSDGDRTEAALLPTVPYPISTNPDNWPLPCKLEGYKSHALDETREPSAERIDALQIIALKQLDADAQHAKEAAIVPADPADMSDKGEADESDIEEAIHINGISSDMADALEALWAKVETPTSHDITAFDEDGEADTTSDAAQAALEIAALWKARLLALKMQTTQPDNSETDASVFNDAEPADGSDALQPTLLQQAREAIEGWASNHVPTARRDALIQYAKQTGDEANGMLLPYLQADFSADVTGHPGEALLAALEQLVKTNSAAATRLAQKAIPFIIGQMPHKNDVQKILKGQALLLCALVSENLGMLNTALVYLSGHEVMLGSIQMPAELTQVAYRALYETLSSHTVFNLRLGPVLRQHLLAQYKPKMPKLTADTSGKSELAQSFETTFELTNITLDNDEVLASLRVLYKRYKSKEDPSTTAILAQAKAMLEDKAVLKPCGLFESSNLFAYENLLETFLLSVAAEVVDTSDFDSENSRSWWLYHAARSGHLLRVKLMLHLGCNVSAKHGLMEVTALIEAACAGHYDVVQTLLAVEGINVSEQTRERNTALMVAAGGGYFEIVSALLAAGDGNINAKNRSGNTALMMAIGKGCIKVVEALLAVDGINVNVPGEDGNTALMKAAYKGHIEIVRALLAVDGIDVNVQDDYDGTTGLMKAAYKGHIEIVRALLAVDGIDVNVPGEDGNTALMQATMKGHLEVLEALLAADSTNINAKNTQGKTALHIAVGLRRLDIVRALLKIDGIDVNTQTKFGMTALMYAIDIGSLEMVQALLAADGIKVNMQAKSGNTALTFAIYVENPEIVKCLLAVDGIDINEQTERGDTALILAAQGGSDNIVRALLAKPGIKPYVRNKAGMDALRVAKGKCQLSIALLTGVDGQWLARFHRVAMEAVENYLVHTPSVGFKHHHGRAGKERARVLKSALSKETLMISNIESLTKAQAAALTQRIIQLTQACVEEKGVLGRVQGLAPSSLNTKLMQALNEALGLMLTFEFERKSGRLPKSFGATFLRALHFRRNLGGGEPSSHGPQPDVSFGSPGTGSG